MTAPSVAPGTVTGAGSLPHVDVAEAVAFALAVTPELPAAPSLPARHPHEGMLAQAAWGLPGVTVAADGTLEVDVDGLEPEACLTSGLGGEPFVALRAFIEAVATRKGPAKLQLTGPVTLALALQHAGAPAEAALAAAASAVRHRAHALLDAAAATAPGVEPLVVLDEPGLVTRGPGRNGRGDATDDAVIDLLSGALAALEGRAVTGVHCCGATDWRAVLQAGPQVLSLPVAAGATAAASPLGDFLERGGWLLWGAVPTDGPVGTDAGRWWRRLSAQWCDLARAGCDPTRLRTQVLLSPACGLGRHGITQAERVMALTAEVARYFEGGS